MLLKVNFHKEHFGFAVFFAAIILLFLGKLVFMRDAFLLGDFMSQFYPWSKVYSGCIQNFQFPFWVKYMHSGFPLMAEGQIGGFYPLNIFMYFFLPFKPAYNYSIVLHFILGGIFTYMYTRRLGANQWGGALSSLIFCFGSAYAGAFCNTAMLKALIWFPLVLLLLDNFFTTKKSAYVVYAGLILGMQFLAGALQLAVYASLFYLIYMLYGFRLKKISLKEGILHVFLFVALSLLIALPQLLLSYQLAQLSNRALASLNFALWGSFNPLGLLSVFFPRWLAPLGQQLYVGIFSILFLIYALKKAKDFPQIRPMIFMAVIAVLLALGKYNPLYVAVLRVTKFYCFRNPAKFLFFALFAGSVLAGFGFSKIFQSKDKKAVKNTAMIFSALLTGALGIFFAAKVFFRFFRNDLIYWAQAYTRKNIVGNPNHRYGLEEYMSKAAGFCEAFIKGASMGNIFTLFSVIMILTALAAGIFIYLKPEKLKSLKAPIICIIVLDLWVYNLYGTGFTNTAPFSYAQPQNPGILKILKSDDDIFRIIPFAVKEEGIPNWARPNASVLYGLDSIAAYTPLVEKEYKDRLSSLEVVDDAMGLIMPDNGVIGKEHKLLRLLNVKYIITARQLNGGLFKKIAEDNGLLLYQVKGYLPRAFFTYALDGDIKAASAENPKILDYRDGFIKIDLCTKKDGFLVFSENYYPGWKAYVDDRRVPIKRLEGIIQVIDITKGRHTVVFKFNPEFCDYEK